QEVVIVNARVAVVGELPVLPAQTAAASGRATVGPARRRVWLGDWIEVPVYRMDALPAGHEVKGPAVFESATTTVLVREGERVPILVLALAAFVAAERAPGLALGVLLAMLFLVTGVGGVLMPAWMDIVGRAIPVTLRGRFFALSNLAASAAGFAGSFLTSHVLETVPAPRSYGICFLYASACMALSYIAL